jgi:hypothetical protein
MQWHVFKIERPAGAPDLRVGSVDARDQGEALARASAQWRGAIRVQSALSFDAENEECRAYGLAPRWEDPAQPRPAPALAPDDPLTAELRRVATLKKRDRDRARRAALIAKSRETQGRDA